MLLRYNLKLVCRSVCAAPLLTLLTVATIAIGITAFLTMLTIHTAMSKNPMQHKNERLFAVVLDSLGSGLDYDGPNEMPVQVTYRDAVALRKSSIPVRSAVMFRSRFIVRSKYPGSNKWLMARARVTSGDFFAMFDVPFLYGKAWTDPAGQAVVLSKNMNIVLFQGENSIGRKVEIDGRVFRVSGVLNDWQLAPKVYDLTSWAFADAEGIYIPFSLTPVMQPERSGKTSSWTPKPINSYDDFLESERRWLQFWVELPGDTKQKEFAKFIESHIKQQRQLGRFQRSLNYALYNPQQWLVVNAAVEEDSKVLVLIALLFFAICLVNAVILLQAKFFRRANEAAIRRALGAARSDIFHQNLLEAMLIGIVGSMLGLVLTWLSLAGVRALYGGYTHIAVINTDTIVMAVAIAFFASLFSGTLPAWFLSRLRPALNLKP